MARIIPDGKWETVADLLAISRIALSVSTVKNPTLQRAGTRPRGALRVVRDGGLASGIQSGPTT